MAKTKIEVDLVIKGGESVEQVENKTKNLKTQLKEIKALLASGTLDNETFNKLSREAGQLQDRIGDVSQKVKNLASDSQTLDGLISATQAIVGGFAAVQGITALVGDENEDLQKTMMKLQGAMSALAGIQAVANALNKTSALTTTLQSVQLRVLNFVEAQRAASLKYTTVAMQQTAFATRMLAAALATLGIGALIAAVVYLIPKITEWITGSKAATKAQKDLTDAIETTDSALESYTNQIDLNAKKELSFAKRRGASAEELAKITIDAEQKKLKALEKSYAEQGALYDKLNDGMVAGTVKMDRELLDQQAEANVKRYEDIVSQSEKISLLKVETDTEARIKQREADAKALEDQKAAQTKANAAAKLKREEALQERIKQDQEALKDREQNAKNEREFEDNLLAEDKAAEDKKIEQAAFTKAYNLELQIDSYKLQKEIDDKALEDKKSYKDQILDIEQSIVNSQIGIAQQAGQFLNQVAGDNKNIALAALAIEKGAAIANIIINTQREISGYYAAASARSALTFGTTTAFDQALAAKQSIFAKVRAGIGIASIGAAGLNGAKQISGGGGSAGGSGGGGGSVSSQPPRMDKFESNRPAMNPNQRVYVLEKDITDSQGRVAKIRHNATLI